MNPRIATAPIAGWPGLTLCWATLALAGVVAYANGFAAPFVFDGDLFADGLEAGQLFPYRLAGANRGLVILTFQANYWLHGLHPWGYHAVNLAIHVASGLLLFGIVRRSLLRPQLAPRYGQHAVAIALVAALFWLVHPLQTQSVTYLIQRFESLMGLFFVLVLYAFVRAVDAPRSGSWLILAVVSCLLGAFCKETIAVAPAVVLWYDRALVATSWRQIWQCRKGFYASLFAAGSVPALGVMLNTKSYTQSNLLSGAGVTTAEYLRSQPGVVLHYLRLACWPDTLCLDYGWPVASGAWSTIGPLIPLLVLAGVTLWGVLRCPPVGFLGAWFFLCLAPTSSLIPIADLAFEHRMYLPLAAVAVAAAVGLDEGLRILQRGNESARVAPDWQFAGLAALLACGLAARTVWRNRDYRDHVTFWRATVAAAPDNWRAHEECGKALARRGFGREAIAELDAANRLHPGSAELLTALGTACFVAQENEAAVDVFRQALAIEPGTALTRVNLAMALERLGHTDEAAGEYAAALAIDPDSAKGHFHYARLLAAGRRDPESAMREYRAALAIDPNYVDAHKGAATTLFECGRYDDAVRLLERAQALAPRDADVCNLLGLCWVRLKRWDSAAACFRRTLAIDPQFNDAARNLTMVIESARADSFGNAVTVPRDPAE